METRFVCIHAHFYQPPRENSWLEAIELQDSAQPYHDWNERICAECYAANAFSRILNEQGQIEQIVNNYARISFNLGPTLLSWMEKQAPEVYQAILEADRESQKLFGGHGSALAQCYNHMIMPLATRRDKYTQVAWAIADFVHRFQRQPEGMWLPETAVDIETLEILAEQGIAFTILTPYQAAKVRPLTKAKEASSWKEVGDGSIDPKEPYLLNLPSGRSIVLFFYDGPISQAVAFEGMLHNGENFARRLLGGFAERSEPQLVHIATDGESYGHHSAHGDMALAYALHFIDKEKSAQLTNYGYFLSRFPPKLEVQIKENSSWSCVHGVERWKSDCGCCSGMHPGWHQRWRAPLREALDALRDRLLVLFEEKGKSLFHDPWQARNDYIKVLLDRAPHTTDPFFAEHGKQNDPASRQQMAQLLEMARYSMLMYTSCGWFFDEISGIETVQVIQYAARALQLAQEISSEQLEPFFIEKLSLAESNLPEYGHGKALYEVAIQSARLGPERMAAHYAISSLFEEYPEEVELFCYQLKSFDYRLATAGRAKLASGFVEISSQVEQTHRKFCFAVLYMGDHQLVCGIGKVPEESFEPLRAKAFERFEQADLALIVYLLHEAFPEQIYSLLSLFRDEQRKVLDRILAGRVEDAFSFYQQLYEQSVPLLRFLKTSATPVPPALYAAGQCALNGTLQQAFDSSTLDLKQITHLLHEAELAGIALDVGKLEYNLRGRLEAITAQFCAAPEQFSLLQQLLEEVELAQALPFSVQWRTMQTLVYRVQAQEVATVVSSMPANEAKAWQEAFAKLCGLLNLASGAS